MRASVTNVINAKAGVLFPYFLARRVGCIQYTKEDSKRQFLVPEPANFFSGVGGPSVFVFLSLVE